MDFTEAKQIGDQGERLVAAELERIASQYGLTVLNDLLLKVGPMTAQLDHVVIDRYGVLIIESKVRRGALLRGSDVEKKWTACYPGRRNVSFQNPLAQNRQHESLVRQALKQAGNPLNPDFVKSAVVFAEADLSQLELDSLGRSRVVDLGGVEGLIKARHDFAVNDGSLAEADVAALAGLFRGLDRSGDAGVVEQHAAHRTEPTPDVRSASYRTGPAPDVRPVNINIGRTRGGSFGSRMGRAFANLAMRVAAAALLLGLFWFFFLGPGTPLLNDYLLSGFRSAGENASSEQTPAGPTVAEAKAALQEIDPTKYAALANPDSPTVTTVPQGTTFTWEYVQATGNAAEIKTVALTLDASGQVVGVNIE